MPVGFHVANRRLDGGPALQFAFDPAMNAAPLA